LVVQEGEQSLGKTQGEPYQVDIMSSSPQEKEVSVEYDIDEDAITAIPPISMQRIDTSHQFTNFTKIDKSNEE